MLATVAEMRARFLVMVAQAAVVAGLAVQDSERAAGDVDVDVVDQAMVGMVKVTATAVAMARALGV